MVAGAHPRRPLLAQAVAVPERPPDREATPGPGGRKRRGVAHCRECGKPLGTTAERKVGRCEDCPASYDEELFERLRAWRVARAGHEKVPAYVVFTDLTLQAIAEVKPTDARALLRVNGIGQSKLTKYADDVLALVAGEPVVVRGEAPAAAE